MNRRRTGRGRGGPPRGGRFGRGGTGRGPRHYGDADEANLDGVEETAVAMTSAIELERNPSKATEVSHGSGDIICKKDSISHIDSAWTPTDKSEHTVTSDDLGDVAKTAKDNSPDVKVAEKSPKEKRKKKGPRKSPRSKSQEITPEKQKIKTSPPKSDEGNVSIKSSKKISRSATASPNDVVESPRKESPSPTELSSRTKSPQEMEKSRSLQCWTGGRAAARIFARSLNFSVSQGSTRRSPPFGEKTSTSRDEHGSVRGSTRLSPPFGETSSKAKDFLGSVQVAPNVNKVQNDSLNPDNIKKGSSATSDEKLSKNNNSCMKGTRINRTTQKNNGVGQSMDSSATNSGGKKLSDERNIQSVEVAKGYKNKELDRYSHSANAEGNQAHTERMDISVKRVKGVSPEVTVGAEDSAVAPNHLDSRSNSYQALQQLSHSIDRLNINDSQHERHTLQNDMTSPDIVQTCNYDNRASERSRNERFSPDVVQSTIRNGQAVNNSVIPTKSLNGSGTTTTGTPQPNASNTERMFGRTKNTRGRDLKNDTHTEKSYQKNRTEAMTNRGTGLITSPEGSSSGNRTSQRSPSQKNSYRKSNSSHANRPVIPRFARQQDENTHTKGPDRQNDTRMQGNRRTRLRPTRVFYRTSSMDSNDSNDVIKCSTPVSKKQTYSSIQQKNLNSPASYDEEEMWPPRTDMGGKTDQRHKSVKAPCYTTSDVLNELNTSDWDLELAPLSPQLEESLISYKPPDPPEIYERVANISDWDLELALANASQSEKAIAVACTTDQEKEQSTNGGDSNGAVVDDANLDNETYDLRKDADTEKAFDGVADVSDWDMELDYAAKVADSHKAAKGVTEFNNDYRVSGTEKYSPMAVDSGNVWEESPPVTKPYGDSCTTTQVDALAEMGIREVTVFSNDHQATKKRDNGFKDSDKVVNKDYYRTVYSDKDVMYHANPNHQRYSNKDCPKTSNSPRKVFRHDDPAQINRTEHQLHKTYEGPAMSANNISRAFFNAMHVWQSSWYRNMPKQFVPPTSETGIPVDDRQFRYHHSDADYKTRPSSPYRNLTSEQLKTNSSPCHKVNRNVTSRHIQREYVPVDKNIHKCSDELMVPCEQSAGFAQKQRIKHRQQQGCATVGKPSRNCSDFSSGGGYHGYTARMPLSRSNYRAPMRDQRPRIAPPRPPYDRVMCGRDPGVERQQYPPSGFPYEVEEAPFNDYEMETNHYPPGNMMDRPPINFHERDFDGSNLTKYYDVELESNPSVINQWQEQQAQQHAVEFISASSSPLSAPDNLQSAHKEAAGESPKEDHSMHSETSSDDSDFMREASELDTCYGLGNIPAEFEPQAVFERRMQKFCGKDSYYSGPGYIEQHRDLSRPSSRSSTTDTSCSTLSGVDRLTEIQSSSPQSKAEAHKRSVVTNYPQSSKSLPSHTVGGYSEDRPQKSCSRKVSQNMGSQPSSGAFVQQVPKNTFPQQKPHMMPHALDMQLKTVHESGESLSRHTPGFSLRDMSAFPPLQSSRQSKSAGQFVYSHVPVGRGNVKQTKDDARVENKSNSGHHVGKGYAAKSGKSHSSPDIGTGRAITKMSGFDRMTFPDAHGGKFLASDVEVYRNDVTRTAAVPYESETSSKSSGSTGSDISVSTQSASSRVSETFCSEYMRSLPTVSNNTDGNYALKRTSVQRGCLLPYYKGPPGVIQSSEVSESATSGNWHQHQRNDLQEMIESDTFGGNLDDNIHFGGRMSSADSAFGISPIISFPGPEKLAREMNETVFSSESPAYCKVVQQMSLSDNSQTMYSCDGQVDQEVDELASKRLRMSDEEKTESVEFHSAAKVGEATQSCVSDNGSKGPVQRAQSEQWSEKPANPEMQMNSYSWSSQWRRNANKLPITPTGEPGGKNGAGRGRIRHNKEFVAVGRDKPAKCTGSDYSGDVEGMGRSQETLDGAEVMATTPGKAPETTPESCREPVASSTPVTSESCTRTSTPDEPSKYVIPARRRVFVDPTTYKMCPDEFHTSPEPKRTESFSTSVGNAQQEMFSNVHMDYSQPGVSSVANEDVVDKFTPQFLRKSLSPPTSSVIGPQNVPGETRMPASRTVIEPQNMLTEASACSPVVTTSQTMPNRTPTSSSQTVIGPRNMDVMNPPSDRTVIAPRNLSCRRPTPLCAHAISGPESMACMSYTSPVQTSMGSHSHSESHIPTAQSFTSRTCTPPLVNSLNGAQNLSWCTPTHHTRTVIGPQNYSRTATSPASACYGPEYTPEHFRGHLETPPSDCCDFSPINDLPGGKELHNTMPSKFSQKENSSTARNKGADERRKMLRMNSMGAALAKCQDDAKKEQGWGRGRVLSNWVQNNQNPQNYGGSAIKFDGNGSNSQQYDYYQERRQSSESKMQQEVTRENLRRRSLNNTCASASQCGDTSSETSSNSFLSFQYTPTSGEAPRSASRTTLKRPGLESVTRDWKQRFRDAYFGMTTPYIDTHCHLDFLLNRSGYKGSYAKYRDENADTFPPNYKSCVAIFCNPKTWRASHGVQFHKILEEDGVFAAVGCHPKCAPDFREGQEHILMEMLRHRKIRALGEIGLDYSHSFKESRDLQISVFRRQMEIAKSVNLPLVIHCRDAEEDCIEQLQQVMPKNYKIHRHCFTGTWEEADRWLKLFPNSMIGLTPLVTHRRSYGPRGVAQNIPLNRLLLETDAPYFVPHKIPKGAMEFSHPGMAVTVAAEVALLRNIDAEQVLSHCLVNSQNFYNLP